jgi:hypothetical protein
MDSVFEVSKLITAGQKDLYKLKSLDVANQGLLGTIFKASKLINGLIKPHKVMFGRE